MADVRLQNVSKIYAGEVRAVDRANLHIRDGEFMVLVGPSGCGKSTLLRMIAGLEEISGGDVLIGDRRVNDVEPGDRDIAMVFQNYALYPHMTVAENLSFGLKMRRLSAAEINRRVQEVAQVLSIEPLLGRQPRALSGGQRQRVALGRAIVRQPRVFLFDEPLSNLDAKLRVQMRTEIARLHQRLKTTMIYVTHDQVEAMTLGDRIVIINRGVIQQVASPMNLYLRPVNRFVAGFIGSPAMNFLEGTVGGGDFQSPGGRFPVLAQGADGPAVLGIRPEHLHLDGAGSSVADGTVEVVERMGHETIVYVDSRGQKLVARAEPSADVVPGQQVRLSAHPTDTHLFAADGDQRRLN